MIDTHSHILYGIDDGARSLEESISILKQMAALGYKKIIATPHYMENTEYVAENKKKKEIVRELKENLKKEDIDLEIYLGNEVYIFEDIVEKIKKQDIFTMNGTNYLLVELPLLEHLHTDLDILFELIASGVHVVLAHPERYTIFKENPKLLEKYTDMGVLLQGNLESFTNKYGKMARKIATRLLKEHKYFILGSDIHRKDSKFFKNYKKIDKKLRKLANIEYLNDLLINNPQKVIDGMYDTD